MANVLVGEYTQQTGSFLITCAWLWHRPEGKSQPTHLRRSGTVDVNASFLLTDSKTRGARNSRKWKPRADLEPRFTSIAGKRPDE